MLAEPFLHEAAIEAGFLDRVVHAEDLLSEARHVAEGLKRLDRRAHALTKLRTRKQTLRTIHSAIKADLAQFVIEGVRTKMKR